MAAAVGQPQCGSEKEHEEWARNAAVANLPPQLTPEYTVVRALGQGTHGMAVEVRGPTDTGHETAPCEPLAVKLVRVNGLDRGDEAETLTEIATARLLGDHPHIVPILRVLRLRLPGRARPAGEPVSKKEPWIGLVMPLAAADLGTMLQRWNALDRTLRAKPRAQWTPIDVRLRELVRAARRDALSQLWCGLAAMHTSGLLHMDIKPQNALLLGAPRPARLPKVGSTDAVALPPADAGGVEAALRALVGVGAGGRWALSDFGLVQRIPGAHRSRKPWQVFALGYRDGFGEAGGAVSERADWYAFGAMAWEVACELAPFAGVQDLAAMRQIIREVGSPVDPEAEANEGDLDWEAVAAARAVFVDRLLPAPAHYLRRLRALAERAGAPDPENQAATRPALAAEWLERAVPDRAEGDPRAAFAGADGIHRAVARLTRWGPGTQAGWRGYWGADFAPLARLVLTLLQPDPADRDRAGADAFFSSSDRRGSSSDARHGLDDDAKRCTAVPARAVRPAGEGGVFAAPRYAVFAQNTRNAAAAMWKRVDRAWFPRAVWRAPGGEQFVQDTVALLAAKMEQDYVYREASAFPTSLDLDVRVDRTTGRADAAGADADLNDYAVGDYGTLEWGGRISLVRGNVERTLTERGGWRPWEGVLLPVATRESPRRAASAASPLASSAASSLASSVAAGETLRRAVAGARRAALQSTRRGASVGATTTSTSAERRSASDTSRSVADLSRSAIRGGNPTFVGSSSSSSSSNGTASQPRRSPRLGGQGRRDAPPQAVVFRQRQFVR